MICIKIKRSISWEKRLMAQRSDAGLWQISDNQNRNLKYQNAQQVFTDLKEEAVSKWVKVGLHFAPVKASGVLSDTTCGWADIDVQTYFAAVFACLQQTHLVLLVFVCRETQRLFCKSKWFVPTECKPTNTRPSVKSVVILYLLPSFQMFNYN